MLIFFSGCAAETVQNTAPNKNTPTGNQNLTASANTPVNTATPPTVANPADEAVTDTADFEGTAGIIEKKNAGIKANGIMSDVRTARHGNYDRVVFEFLGPELPGYHLEYIDKPVRACGSGNVMPLQGDGWLEVRFTDAAAHALEGDTTIPDRERLPNLPIIKEMKLTCDFEGEVTWVLGVSSPNHYHVLELKNPTRLAVDIRHK